ncbi:MAG: thioredoxin domain-containing protein [Pyrinomonadaceae bacterium]
MKLLVSILISLIAFSAFAQKPNETLATSTGHTFTAADLSAEAQDAFAKFPALMAAYRKQILAQMLGGILLETEAKARNTTTAALIKLETAKVKDPAAAAIQAVYDSNRSQFGDLTLDKVRPQIVAFLRREPEEKAVKAYVDILAAKYKVVYGKDVGTADLKPADLVFSMTGRTVLAQEFEDLNKVSIYEIQVDFYDDLRSDLGDAIHDTLVNDEARSQKIDAGDLIAREITSKLKDYSDAEREGLENAFRQRLFTKYAVKIMLNEPLAPVQSISVDDDPATGPADAPVTIVMFSDFQCSACSAAHPILKAAMAAYPGKVRFVVRDFPLESIHENSFRAALAANAASTQGKFFEYTEVLYTHQNALDDASLKKYAAELGLNAKQFELEFNSEKTRAEIRKDIADGASYGINSTPTIFINGIKVRNISAAAFRTAIDRALAK